MKTGKIIKGIGGFYYVDCDGEVFECKARGSFRKQGITPLVGDNVNISVFDNSENAIETILPRKNELIRPPLANLDSLFIVASLVDPKINTLILDNLIAVAEYKKIEPVIVLTKIDLDDSADKYKSIYENAGFKVVLCDNTDSRGADEIRTLLGGKCSAFTGNTGVGKSSLLNNIFPSLNLATGETSKILGRGRHTTRHCELFKVDGGYIADTPGFSSLYLMDMEEQELKDYFPEFRKYDDQCRFQGCRHIHEPGCRVKEALEEGEISRIRYEDYLNLYEELKEKRRY